MVSFGLDQTGVEGGELRIYRLKGLSENLKFFAASALNQSAADQVIDDLFSASLPDLMHEPSDPSAREGLAEKDASLAQQAEHPLKVLELFDRDGVQLVHSREELMVFLQSERGCGRLSLQMGMIYQHFRKVVQNGGDPVRWNLFAKQQHRGRLRAIKDPKQASSPRRVSRGV